MAKRKSLFLAPLVSLILVLSFINFRLAIRICANRVVDASRVSERADFSPDGFSKNHAAAKCPNQCSINGICVDGQCSCDVGFVGRDCWEVAECTCQRTFDPADDLEAFMTTIKYRREEHKWHLKQILSDLGPWSEGGISQELIDEAEAFAIARIKVINNKLYVKKKHTQLNLRCFVGMMLALLRRVKIPDTEFILGLADVPMVMKHSPLPIFTVVKTDAHSDILVPDGFFFSNEWTNRGAMRLDLIDYPWRDKIDKLVWRGATTGRWTSRPYTLANWRYWPRTRLMMLGKKRPDLLDVGFSLYYTLDQEVHDELNNIGARKDYLSMHSQLKWKYTLSVDGNGCSGRYAAWLAGDSVAFKQSSPFYEWYYHQLEPYVHYVPVKYDLSDLIQKVEWAKDHDEEAHAIAVNGRLFVQEHMRPESVLCYLGSVLTEYSKLLGYKPRLTNDSVLIPQVFERPCPCADNETFHRVFLASTHPIPRYIIPPPNFLFSSLDAPPPTSIPTLQSSNLSPIEDIPTPPIRTATFLDDSISDETFQELRTFLMVPGFLHPPDLKNSAYVSFESAKFRGHFLRHKNGLLQLARFSHDREFHHQATFILRRPIGCDRSRVLTYEKPPYLYTIETLDSPGNFVSFGKVRAVRVTNKRADDNCTIEAENFNVEIVLEE